MRRPPSSFCLFPYTTLFRSQERGVVNAAPGLYFVGLHFQYAMSSATVIGVSRDAERIVKGVAERMKNRGSERSEEHTSELQSHVNLVCRLLLEKKKKKKKTQ